MTMKMPTRATLLFGMAAAVALGLASAPADAQTKIRGGISVRFEGMLAVFAAQDFQLDAEHVVEVQFGRGVHGVLGTLRPFRWRQGYSDSTPLREEFCALRCT